MESLTLNLYGIIPSKNNQYINSVLGFSALRFDNKYLGKLSGERKMVNKHLLQSIIELKILMENLMLLLLENLLME